MSSSRLPSVNDTYFQHKVLTKIHGTPTYESLQNLTTELKANAGSVPSTLGGGLYGHLGLLVSAARYATLAHTVPWVNPPNPGPFAPPAGGTAAQIEAAKEVWRDSKFQFELYQATTKALVAQIVEAIDPIYIRALLNRATGQYSTSARALIQHLFTTYGKITPQQVKGKEVELYNLHYDISQPVDTVFNAIDDLADLAEHSNSPMTANQMIDLAYIIFAKSPVLHDDLRLWNRRPVIERTWANMSTHLRDAQSDLGSLPTAGDIYHQQPAHQANSIVSIADQVAQRLLDAIGPPDLAPPPPPELANALQQRESSLEAREAALLTQMQTMMSMMQTDNNNNNNSNRGRGRRGGGNDRNPGNNRNSGNDRNRSYRAVPDRYCWTHGACRHLGTACHTPAPGHQAAATFTNLLGGSGHPQGSLGGTSLLLK